MPDGQWCLGPALDSGYFPIPTTVQVLGGASSEEVIVEARVGFFVAGRVLGPGGEPVPSMQVYGRGRSCTSGPDGAFRIGPFEAGSVTLTVFATDLVALEPLTVQAGQEGVVLRLVAGGRLAGRLVKAATGEPAEGTVNVSGSRGRIWFTNVGPTGEFAFEGLEPGEYGIAARSPDGGAGFVERVLIAEPGGGRDDLVVSLAPGGKLALRFPTGDEHVSYRLRSGDCVLVSDSAGTEDVVTPYVPAGQVTVDLLARGYTVLLTKEAVVRAGETVLVDLSKEP